jgi:dTDP-D-glucose 4,6-dehydratase
MNGVGHEDMRRRAPDTSKIKALIGWQPTISLDQTVDEVIEEFRVGRVAQRWHTPENLVSRPDKRPRTRRRATWP